MNLKKNIPLIVTVLTIFSNIYFPLNEGVSIGDVSKQNELLANPSGWAFSIWGIIYTALLNLGYKHSVKDFEWNNLSLILYTLSGVCNALWIVNWVKFKTETSQYILYILTFCLLFLWFENKGKQNNKIYQNSIALYATWTLGASLLNTGINLKPSIGEKKSSDIVTYGLVIAQILWQIISNLTANNSGNNRKESFMIPITGIWTGLAILTNNKDYNLLLKSLPFISALGSGKYHLNKIGIKSNNPIKIIKKLVNLLK